MAKPNHAKRTRPRPLPIRHRRAIKQRAARQRAQRQVERWQRG